MTTASSPGLDSRAVASHSEVDAPADRVAALALLDAWYAGAYAEDQRETLESLTLGLDAGRPGQRRHFPPELKGKTW